MLRDRAREPFATLAYAASLKVAYRKLYKQSNAAQPLGKVVGAARNSFPYFTAISKKNLA